MIQTQILDPVSITITIPKQALDWLGFRYYPLGITNDTGLAETAIQEAVQYEMRNQYEVWQQTRASK